MAKRIIDLTEADAVQDADLLVFWSDANSDTRAVRVDTLLDKLETDLDITDVEDRVTVLESEMDTAEGRLDATEATADAADTLATTNAATLVVVRSDLTDAEMISPQM